MGQQTVGRESEYLAMTWAYETSKPTLRDTLSLIRSHISQQNHTSYSSKLCQQQTLKYMNLCGSFLVKLTHQYVHFLCKQRFIMNYKGILNQLDYNLVWHSIIVFDLSQ